MGQPLEVVVTDLAVASARLADARQRLQDGLSAVDLSVDQLMGSGWKGGAASAYRNEWDKWHSGAGQIIRGLQSMSESLKAAGDQYASSDQQGAEAVGSTLPPSPAPSSGAAGSGTAPAGTAPAGAATASTGPSADVTSSGRGAPGAADPLAQLMNLGGPATQAAGQAAGQAGQPASGLMQAATGLARAITEMAQAAGDERSEDAAEQPAVRDRQDDRPEEADPSGDRTSSAPVDDAPPTSPPADDPAALPRPTRAG